MQAWAVAARATPDELSDLAELFERIATAATSWRTLHRLGLGERQRDLAELERQALHIQTFQASMIPGLLQTADYARRMLTEAFPSTTSEDIQARMERQAVLYDESKRFDFIITESALRWRPSGVSMAPQIDRLRSMATLPNVTISVVPLGAESPPILHPFVMWHLEDEVLVSVETYSAELWIREAADVTRYRDMWDRLSADAVEGLAWLRDR